MSHRVCRPVSVGAWRGVAGAFAAAVCLCLPTWAQQARHEAAEPTTALERLQLTHGQLVIKGYSTVASIALPQGGHVAVEVTELRAGGHRTRGLVIEVREGTRIERTERAFVDADEVAALITATAALAETKGDITKLAEFEASFKTRGGLSVTTFSSGGRIVFSVAAGRALRSHAFLRERSLVERFVVALKDAKEQLDLLARER